MKRIFLTSVLAIVAIVGVNAQLLYKISGNGIGKPSYIVGTYHLAPASYVDSIPGANEALASVEQVCGEVDMAEMESMAGMQKLMAAMMLPDGKSLSDILSEEEMGKLNAFMNEVMGADLNNPLIAAQLGKMTPAAIANQLQLVQYMKMTPGFNPNALIDSYFQSEAKKTDKPVIGFETLDFQISVLYTGSTIERQKEQLICMIDNQEYNQMIMEQLTKAYFSQDIDAVLAVTEVRKTTMYQADILLLHALLQETLYSSLPEVDVGGHRVLNQYGDIFVAVQTLGNLLHRKWRYCCACSHPQNIHAVLQCNLNV
mgnify:CR=1 FL=1